MKTFKYITMGVAASLLATSCDINEAPEFNDGDAFVAFSAGSATVKEDAQSPLTVKLSVASVAGKAGNVDVYVDAEKSTAVEGKDFTISSKTFKFDADHRTLSLEIMPIPNGVYTGDMKITLGLSSSDLNLGNEKECVVTISDVEHPLAAILHDYKAAASSYFSNRGSFEWTISLEKDAEDVEKVWIYGIDPYFAVNGYTGPIYGTVVMENGQPAKILVPVGQQLGYKTATVEVFSHPDPDDADARQLGSGENMEIIVEDNGHKLTIYNSYGVYMSGWYNLMYGNLVITY